MPSFDRMKTSRAGRDKERGGGIRNFLSFKLAFKMKSLDECILFSCVGVFPVETGSLGGQIGSEKVVSFKNNIRKITNS